jgi:hypothetical protein
MTFPCLPPLAMSGGDHRNASEQYRSEQNRDLRERWS